MAPALGKANLAQSKIIIPFKYKSNTFKKSKCHKNNALSIHPMGMQRLKKIKINIKSKKDWYIAWSFPFITNFRNLCNIWSVAIWNEKKKTRFLVVVKFLKLWSKCGANRTNVWLQLWWFLLAYYSVSGLFISGCSEFSWNWHLFLLLSADTTI